MRAALAFLAALATGPATAECRLALVLGLDVSGSVDPREYRLQLDGVAGALETTGAQKALFSMPGAHVDIAIYQWGAPWQQRLLLDWTTLRSAADTALVAAQMRAASHNFSDPSTAIGSAIEFGVALLSDRPDCWAHTIDISGDGPSNSGPPPGSLTLPAPPYITVNGLVVNPLARDNIGKDLSRAKTLRNHYETQVIRGPGAFVEVADSFQDFERAMTRKLIREVQPAVVGVVQEP